MLSEDIDNRCIIAERINEAGYQTKASKTWDKDIYSAWKRHKDIVGKLIKVSFIYFNLLTVNRASG